jgi:methylated-DNA-[protein]-cysteine S-methyltransferase
MNEIERELRLALAGDGVDGTAESVGAARAFARRAEDLGLVDVAYTTVDSPLGVLLVAGTGRGVVRLAFADEGVDPPLAELARQVSPRLLEVPERLDAVRRELDEYFAGRRRVFDVPVDLRLSAGFRRRVLRATARIPYGSTATYGQVAARAGSERAVRAAGSALGANPVPVIVPCHRVVRSTGHLGGYTGGLGRKAQLLRLESPPG